MMSMGSCHLQVAGSTLEHQVRQRAAFGSALTAFYDGQLFVSTV